MTANRSTLSDLDLSNMTLSSNHNNSIDSQLNINGQGFVFFWLNKFENLCLDQFLAFQICEFVQLAINWSNTRLEECASQFKNLYFVIFTEMFRTCYNTHNARERKKLNEGRPCQNCHKVKTLGCRNMCRFVFNFV